MDRWEFVNEKWIPRPFSRGKGCDTEIPLSHPTSAPSGHLLPMEGGSVHASPFPWKGLPSAARRGWLPFCGARVLSLMVYLRRSLPALFHTARTLSGSLRSPPSPRGEGFVRRYFFLHICVYSLRRCEKSGILVSQPSPLGKGDRTATLGCSR